MIVFCFQLLLDGLNNRKLDGYFFLMSLIIEHEGIQFSLKWFYDLKGDL